MFRWAIIFAVIALIASLLGFGGVAGLSKDFAVIFISCGCNSSCNWVHFPRPDLNLIITI